VQLPLSSDFGPPSSDTVSCVTGTSGIVWNVTACWASEIVPVSVRTAGGGKRNVSVGATGEPVRYACPWRGVVSSGVFTVALPTGVAEFCSESELKFGASVGHGRSNAVDALAASFAACVTVVLTAAP